MENKEHKQLSAESNLQKLKNQLQSYFPEKKDNKKKCKCPELLQRKTKCHFNDDLPYHIKKKFTKNILLSTKDDKIVLISTNEYNNNLKTSKDKSNSILPQVNLPKNKCKIDSKSNISLEEIGNNNNIKDILIEISEISADLELFEMEKRKRKMMKLIELMAGKIDNNITNPNELIDLFTLDQKMNP